MNIKHTIYHYGHEKIPCLELCIRRFNQDELEEIRNWLKINISKKECLWREIAFGGWRERHGYNTIEIFGEENITLVKVVFYA